MPRSDFWSGLVVAAFGVLALVWMIPNYAGSNPFAQMPPELVPNIAAWIMVVCGGVVAAGGLVGMVRARLAPLTRELDWRGVLWVAWPFVYVGVAVWVLTMIKITWAGAFLIGGMLVLLGERRWWMILGCSVVPVALLYVLSVYLMRVGVV
ncbi:MAG: tripartite tricarboxylate transporter TctB family protein [Alkalilacustris sp.]